MQRMSVGFNGASRLRTSASSSVRCKVPSNRFPMLERSEGGKRKGLNKIRTRQYASLGISWKQRFAIVDISVWREEAYNPTDCAHLLQKISGSGTGYRIRSGVNDVGRSS